MLVLTRRIGEKIIIDDTTIVTVVALEGNKVRLGIEAPRSVRVDRAEIHQRRLKEQADGLWADAVQDPVLVGSDCEK